MTEKVKPKLRGVSHFIAFCTACAASLALLFSPLPGEAHLGGVIYAASVVVMFGLSGLYHRPMWTHAARRIVRRVDHAGVFFLISGSYAAFWTLAPPGERSVVLLAVMWGAAMIGAITFVVWTDMPRVLRAGTYVVLGLSSSPLVAKLPAIIGWPRAASVIAGSAIYILGAAIYARRWPNPNPRVFGYHEVFHVFVIVAAGLHYGVIVDVHWNG